MALEDELTRQFREALAMVLDDDGRPKSAEAVGDEDDQISITSGQACRAILAALTERKAPHCSTCGKDVPEVLCPTCAKWWADNPPSSVEVEGLVGDGELRVGQVQWHCSEEDGGPDVGILLRLDADHLLWWGELLAGEGDGFGTVIYGPGDDRKVFEAAYDELRQVFEEYVAPAIAAQATELATLKQQLAEREEALRECAVCGVIVAQSEDAMSCHCAERPWRRALTDKGPEQKDGDQQ